MLPIHRQSSMPTHYSDDKYQKRSHHSRIKVFLAGLWNCRRLSLLITLLFTTLTIYTWVLHDGASSDEFLDVMEPADVKIPLSPTPNVPNNQHVIQQDQDTPILFTQQPPPKKLCPSDDTAAYRQQRVVEAFRHAWKGYAEDAFGMDEYQPLTHQGRNWASGGIGLMIVDSLDTMLLMNLTEEYNEAREWVATKLDFDKDQDVNVFETTIRVLGGLLSAYHLSGNDPVYLDKATDLGNRLLGAFQTESGIPYASVVLSTGLPYKFHIPSSTAEVTTVQLEFKYLSYLTGDPKYWTAAERVMLKMKHMNEQGQTLDGLVPILINPVTGRFDTHEIRLGSRGDSYYGKFKREAKETAVIYLFIANPPTEYLIKQYLQTEKTEPLYLDMYRQTVHAIRKHLLSRSEPNQLLYIGELLSGVPGVIHPKMDHLVCFMAGSLALGATQGLTLAHTPLMTDGDNEDLKMGEELARTCYEMYNVTATGLASEIVYFNTDAQQGSSDILIQPRDRHNLLRPETVESLFLLHRITGDPIYSEWGWRIFESFEKYAKLPGGGYAALRDVTKVPPSLDNRMDTFFLAETLKYLYLLFSPDDFVPLDRYVFNSEGHPLPMFQPSTR